LRFSAGVLALALAAPAFAISPEAKEFIEISKKLESVHCQKRKITREIAVAEAERDAERSKALRAEFRNIASDKQTAGLEKRLQQLEPRIVDKEGKARRSEDLDAIDLQRREAFYRCG
jgi:predicted  nucleic acid-binding Zn-ribbon protein